MFDPVGLVSISLGSVVLDRPDQTGRYFAKDLVGGWAYLIGDIEGDNRCRGQGVCDGGLDLTLRCAFLSAVNRVPNCGQIRILVESRGAHRMMVRLAMRDLHVTAAIAGRPVSVLTRPEARSSFQVHTAAERAASIALRTREHAEWNEPAPALDQARVESAGPIPVVAAMRAAPDWRARLDVRKPHLSAKAGIVAPVIPNEIPMIASLSAAGRKLINPLMKGARDGLIAAGMLAPRHAPRNRAMTTWLQDLDSHVATVRGDLQDVGI